MTNELLWCAMLVFTFVFVILLYRTMGKAGLFLWIPVSVIIANIQVVKTITLFGLTATLGNIVYASTFLVTDILSEIYGTREARKAVVMGFVSLLGMIVLTQFALWFVPGPDDFSQEHLEAIFSLMPRIVLASLVAYLVSQFHDVWAFHFWKERFPSWLWFRNNASTMVSQLLDSAIFSFLAFAGVYPLGVVVEIAVTTYLFKWIVAALDTPFLYLAVWLKRRDLVPEE
ncbi:protein of unknown function DUF165 [Spirochaeta thermophila DSM 6578]|uniref:Probable queuosine precursor transporter n=1 Tax=Winmispira thermophila (strain ATCC 700085 / DSM 6578 / Z-1203) TaxID=869211 RepID=G0GCV2_WINT7|nr:queuosine precursor transporter [Spirochaeta thermophila]AEJ61244.1 protein of unknown function DUF165 [Spirochaeta thermophila DSM 6578]